MACTPKLELQAIFDARSGAIYSGMVARSVGKRSQAGPVLRVGRQVPFSLTAFREWLLAQLGGDVAGVVACAYCRDWLNVATVNIDHCTPLAAPWCGSLDFPNLACACGSCNRRKGKMSAVGFRLLVAWGVVELDPRDFRDMLGRMANGGANLKEKWAKTASLGPTLHIEKVSKLMFMKDAESNVLRQ